MDQNNPHRDFVPQPVQHASFVERERILNRHSKHVCSSRLLQQASEAEHHILTVVDDSYCLNWHWISIEVNLAADTVYRDLMVFARVGPHRMVWAYVREGHTVRHWYMDSVRSVILVEDNPWYLHLPSSHSFYPIHYVHSNVSEIGLAGLDLRPV